MVMVMFLLGIFFVMSMQPVFMVSSLIIMTLIYSYIIYNVMKGYWFSYALVMVMLSGVMVVFIYMASLMPNEVFENYNLVLVFVVMMMVMIQYNYLYVGDEVYMCLSLWFFYVGLYNLFMVGFLFGMMLVVVWLSYMSEGAVRVLYLGAWM